MLRYSLAKLATRPKGTQVTLPPVQVRLAAEKEYYTALKRMLTQIATETRDSVLPAYQAELAMKRDAASLTADADRTWFNRLRSVINQLTGTAAQTVSRILGLEAQRHSKNFMEVAKKALGIDLRAVVADEDLDDYLRLAVEQNVSLITGLGDDVLKRIEQTVYNNSIAGNSAATLRKELAKQFGISDKRAKLIARDQAAKLTSNLNQIRQQQAGISEYDFSTSHDERVRATHAAMEGRRCRWDNPSVYRADDGSWTSRSGVGGVALHPGQDIQCRCVGLAVVVF